MRLGQGGYPVGRGAEEHPVARLDGLDSQGDCQMSLADAGRSETSTLSQYSMKWHSARLCTCFLSMEGGQVKSKVAKRPGRRVAELTLGFPGHGKPGIFRGRFGFEQKRQPPRHVPIPPFGLRVCHRPGFRGNERQRPFLPQARPHRELTRYPSSGESTSKALGVDEGG
jgi:hypothetical protein